MRKRIILIIIFNLSTDNLTPIIDDMESNRIAMETLEDNISNGTLNNDIRFFIGNAFFQLSLGVA